jgi:hypothetical protein
MESPYYEMTHDIQYENNLQKMAFNAGYSQGICNENARLIEYLIQMPDHELINWVHDLRRQKNILNELKKYIMKGMYNNLENDKKEETNNAAE